MGIPHSQARHAGIKQSDDATSHACRSLWKSAKLKIQLSKALMYMQQCLRTCRAIMFRRLFRPPASSRLPQAPPSRRERG